ncbi:hypothetical protein GLYMA_07G089751v4 [Glycine max]|nr:hypothetical protein GLYMA_07G089751v4 [Glycine max]
MLCYSPLFHSLTYLLFSFADLCRAVSGEVTKDSVVPNNNV